MTTTCPSQVLKQDTLNPAEASVSTGGSVTVRDCVITQPFRSVTVQVYEPAVNALAPDADPPKGVHAYE